MGCKRIFGATLSMGIAAGLLDTVKNGKPEGKTTGKDKKKDFGNISPAAERTYHGNDLGAVYSADFLGVSDSFDLGSCLDALF